MAAVGAARPARPRRCRLSGRGQVANRAVRRRAPALRRRQRLRRRSGVADRPDAAAAEPVRGHRGSGDRRVRDRCVRGDHRRPGRGRRRHRARRRGDRLRDRRRLPRRRRPRVRPRHRRCRSDRSRAPTCSARRPSCSRPSRASAASRNSARRTRRNAASIGLPTVVHNVQTLAAVPWIVREGAEAFAAIGATDSPGTILVKVRTPAGDGVAEVPVGTKLRDIVRLGGKLPAGREIKAILVGGPSGGLLPADAARHALRLRSAAGRRRPHRLGLDRRRRRPRRPASSSCGVLTRFCSDRGLRQVDPVPDRDPPPRRDRRAARSGPRPTHGRPRCHGSRGRHRRLRAVRPRAPGHPPADQRDAILRVRVRDCTPARAGRTEATHG